MRHSRAACIGSRSYLVNRIDLCYISYVTNHNATDGADIMSPDKQNKLYADYPELFRQKDFESNRTLMGQGIAVGDGWYQIVADLCEDIQKHTDAAMASDPDFRRPEFFQIKNSYGELRIQLMDHTPIIEAFVEKAKKAARVTCESCGEPGEERAFRGWHKVTCLKCHSKIPFWQL